MIYVLIFLILILIFYLVNLYINPLYKKIYNITDIYIEKFINDPEYYPIFS